MKKTIQTILLVGVLAFAPACSTYKKLDHLLTTAANTSVTPETAKEILVDAQKTTRVAKALFTQFLKTDMMNKDLLKAHAPKVHEFANYLRTPIGNPPVPRDVAVLNKLIAATDAFEANQTSSGAADLRTAIAVVKNLLSTTQSNLNTIQKLTP